MRRSPSGDEGVKIEVPEDMKWTWMAWRLIESKHATFTEVTEKMSLTDIMKLHDAIEAVAYAELKLRKQLENNK